MTSAISTLFGKEIGFNADYIAPTPTGAARGGGSVGADDRAVMLLAEYLPELANQRIYLDGDLLVGGTVDRTNAELGQIQMRRAREGYGYAAFG